MSGFGEELIFDQLLKETLCVSYVLNGFLRNLVICQLLNQTLCVSCFIKYILGSYGN